MHRHVSFIELSKSALKTNFNFIRKKIGSDRKISAVVKANAYGHGIETYVPMAEACGIDHFAVSSCFEAEEVKSICKPTSDIMIMGIFYRHDLPWILKNGVEIYVFNYDRLPVILDFVKQYDSPARIHIEVETGTNRTGMSAGDIKQSIKFLKQHPDSFILKGVCSHLGGAESFANRFRLDRQIKEFDRIKKQFIRADMPPEHFHLACSAAALAWPETLHDMVRIGVTQYGFWPSPEIYYHHLQETGKRKDSPLKRVLTWKTNVMEIKKVKKGEFIGYGTAYQAYRDMVIAVLPLGYGNGYSRSLSNKGFVLIRGRKAPIVGLINMNLFMVDITHFKEVETNDEVVLIGKQKNNKITVGSFSNSSQQINNEMLARLPAAIPRIPKR
jgi:alanine racemase